MLKEHRLDHGIRLFKNPIMDMLSRIHPAVPALTWGPAAMFFIGYAIYSGMEWFHALWLVPVLAAVPSLPWIAFTGTLAMAYTFFLQDPWAIPWWARAVEAAPLAAGAGWWLYRRRPLNAFAERSA